MTAEQFSSGDVRVTIAVPTFNGVERLRRAIDSVRAQTFAEWELWVLDAGSTDGTADLLRAYGDPRIHHRRNIRRIGSPAGPSHLVHTGSGPFIGWLPDDAVLFPDHLRRLTCLLEAYPRAAVAHGAVEVTDAGGVVRAVRATASGRPFEESPAAFTRHAVAAPPRIHTAAALLRRSAVWALRFSDADGPSCGHLGFWLRAGRCGTVVHDPVVTARTGDVSAGDPAPVVRAFLAEARLPRHERVVLRTLLHRPGGRAGAVPSPGTTTGRSADHGGATGGVAASSPNGASTAALVTSG